jgi:hypothetical protein
VLHVWRRLPHERRLAALAAVALFVTLFLPWYQETVIASGVTSLRSVSVSLTGWGAFSFVEAAVLLVAAGVLTLLFVRAEGQAFHVPGGDGGVIMAAGLWTCVLIIWRMFDKEGTTGHGQYADAAGIEWGIFVALGVAGLLTYAGSRIRSAREPEPPLPGEAGQADEADRRPERPRPRSAATRTARAARRETGLDVDRTRPRALVARSERPPADSPQGSSAPAGAPAESTPAGGSTRKRPRSVGAPIRKVPSASSTEPGADESPMPHVAPEPSEQRGHVAGRGEIHAHRNRQDSGPEEPEPRPTLDPREIAELDIAEPPAPRLRRSTPAAVPPRKPAADSDEADEQVTLRFDRPH